MTQFKEKFEKLTWNLNKQVNKLAHLSQLLCAQNKDLLLTHQMYKNFQALHIKNENSHFITKYYLHH